ncbi:MAG: hypothetical protein PHQ12_04725 [Chthoniobacteraceae bacterium]|nr:hypothetical protein [Chthoniobacteraceae bacterium]
MNRIHLLSFLAWVANLHLAHWQADTLCAAHETLGDLYEAVDKAIDKLAEVDMGRAGSADFPEGQSFSFQVRANLGELLGAGLAEINALRADPAVSSAEDLRTILADLEILINRAKFLLKV